MSKLTQGQKISIGLGALAFCGVITAAVINHSHGQPSQSVSQSISNGNSNIQAGGNVTVQSPTINVTGGNNQIGNSNTQIIGGDGMPPDTKQAIRSLFKQMNPEILTQIDEGKTEIHVMLGNVSEVKLAELSERQDFKNYLSYQKDNGIMITGSSNHIQDFINEAGQNGEMWGFILYPKDALKR
jgi:hypothetical protein